MLLLPTLHGIQQTDYNSIDQASMALLGIIQYLHQINIQLLEGNVVKNSRPSSCQMKWFDLLLAN